jgi:hypothetical protein
MAAIFPLLLIAHVALAVALLLPSVVLPFLLGETATTGPRGAATTWLVRLQSDASIPITLGVAATGVALVLLLGVELLQRGWLLAALTLYAINLVVAVAVARPEVRSLLGRRGDEARLPQRARRARWIAYLMAGLIGLIGVLMMVKPELA